MNFPKPIDGKVKRGEATLTIRPATGRAPKHGDRKCVKQAQGADKQPKPVLCHIIIAEAWEMWAGEVTFQQARACGFRTTDDFKAAWVAQWDKTFMKTLVEMDDAQAHEAAVARFERRHAGRRAQAIRFTLAVDTPRFLADQRVSHGGDDDGQYVTTRARAIDDLECIDELMQKRYAERAAKEAERQRASFRRDLEAERARRKGLNASLSTRTLRRVNDFYDRQARRAA
jgi:hypothetical protein